MKPTTNTFPFMSVVIIAFNGAATIKRSVNSILAQDYPKDRYEIIVVNDGSADNTGAIVAQYKNVLYIEHPKNLGISAARNTGMQAAKGEIYVAFDCDCVAKSDWLRELAKGYELAKPAGVCGKLIDLEPMHGVLQTYIGVLGQGLPGTKPHAAAKIHPFLGKLLSYMGHGLHRFDKEVGDYSEVNELYGANCSFPMEILRQVGGWNHDMTWIEDRALSFDILKLYPDHHFYAMHHAQIMNDPSTTLKTYLLRPYRRGPANYRFHKVNKLTVPLFPYPFAMLLALGLAAFIQPLAILPILLLLPQLLYFWWPYHAVVRQQPMYILFPYLQVAEETMVLAGLFRGYLKYNK